MIDILLMTGSTLYLPQSPRQVARFVCVQFIRINLEKERVDFIAISMFSGVGRCSFVFESA